MGFNADAREIEVRPSQYQSGKWDIRVQISPQVTRVVTLSATEMDDLREKLFRASVDSANR